jgi:hypothetical protein
MRSAIHFPPLQRLPDMVSTLLQYFKAGLSQLFLLLQKFNINLKLNNHSFIESQLIRCFSFAAGID